MIQMQSIMHVADNSGAKLLRCIKVLGGTNKRFAFVGDVVVVAVIKAAPNGKVKKGEIHRAVIIRTKFPTKRSDGRSIRFDSNAALLINKSYEPIGSRASGVAARELKKSKCPKAVSLIPEVL